MVIRWGEIWTVHLEWEKLQFLCLNHFNGCCCHMKLNIVVMQNNSIHQYSSVFSVKSGFQLLFKHITILCTIDFMSTILVVLEDGPSEVPKQQRTHF